MQDVPVIGHQASQRSYLIQIPIGRLTVLLSFILYVFLQTVEANAVKVLQNNLWPPRTLNSNVC